MIILITGGFGVGKDIFADYLTEALPNSQKIKSYTTRPPRYPGENTHIFTDQQPPTETVAKTIIDNQSYWTIPSQFDKNKNNIYVVDDIGVRDTVASNIDKVFIILITRPKHLIQIDKKRLNRTRTEKFHFEPDIEILNDGTLQDLQKTAQTLPILLPLYKKF